MRICGIILALLEMEQYCCTTLQKMEHFEDALERARSGEGEARAEGRRGPEKIFRVGNLRACFTADKSIQGQERDQR